jgi:hypothetical protein
MVDVGGTTHPDRFRLPSPWSDPLRPSSPRFPGCTALRSYRYGERAADCRAATG